MPVPGATQAFELGMELLPHIDKACEFMQDLIEHPEEVWPRIPLMTPAKDPKQQNRAQNRDQKDGNTFHVFFKYTAQKSREYSHWIDLTLNSHFEAVISEIYRTKVRLLSKSTFLGSTKRSKKVQKGPAAPKPIL